MLRQNTYTQLLNLAMRGALNIFVDAQETFQLLLPFLKSQDLIADPRKLGQCLVTHRDFFARQPISLFSDSAHLFVQGGQNYLRESASSDGFIRQKRWSDQVATGKGASE